MLIKVCEKEVGGLDPFPVHYKEEEIDYVVKQIAKSYTGKEPLILYTNCWCDVRIDGIPVARQYDNLLYSKEADIALIVSRMLDPQKLIDALGRYGLDYTVMVANKPQNDGFIDDSNIPGFYPVREKSVLGEAATEALGEYVNEADVYPNLNWSFMVGYSKGEDHYVLYSIGGLGVVDTKINCSLIISNGDPRNIKPSMLAEEVRSLGLTPTIIESGHPAYVHTDPSAKTRK